MNPQSPREELEVRITALLMGELPPDEAAALQTQIAADAELTALHARLQRASGLLREATAGHEPHAMLAPPVRLSEERRARLLAHFKGETKPGPVIVKPRRDWRWAVPLGLAASLMALIGGAMYVNGFALRRESVSQRWAGASDSDGERWASQPGMVRVYESKAKDSHRSWGFSEKATATSDPVYFESLNVVRESEETAARGGEVADARAHLAGATRYAKRGVVVPTRSTEAPPPPSQGPLGTGALYLPSTATVVPTINLTNAPATTVVAQGVADGMAITDNRSVSFGGVISNPEPATEFLAASALNPDRSATREFASYDTEGAKPLYDLTNTFVVRERTSKVPAPPESSVVLDGSSAVVLNSSISAAGGLVKAGSGTLDLTGANAFTGGTTTSGGGVLHVGDPVAGVSIAAIPADPALQAKPAIAPSGPATREIKLRSDIAPDQMDASRFASTTLSRSPEPNLAGRPRVTATPAPAGKSAQPLADASDSPAKPAAAKPASEHFFRESKQEDELRVTLGTASRGLGVSAIADGKEGVRDAVAALSKRSEMPISRTAGGDVTFPMTPMTPTAFPREEPLALGAKVVEFEGFANTGRAKRAADVFPDGAFAGKADSGTSLNVTSGGQIAFWTEDETSKVNINPAAAAAPVNRPATTSLGLVPKELRDGLENGLEVRLKGGTEFAVTLRPAPDGTTDFGTVSGIITGNIGNGTTTLSKAGSGTWNLKGANTYSGTTTVNAGTFSVNGGAVLNFDTGTASNTINALTFGGASTTVEMPASVTTKSGQRATVETDRKFNYQADFDAPEIPRLIVAKDSGAVTKAGDGILDLNGRSTFAGGINVTAGNVVLGDLAGGDASHVAGEKNAAVTNHKTEEVKRTLVEAKGYAELGRLDLADRSYQEAIKLDPYNAAARQGREEVANQKMRSASASYDATRAIAMWEVEKEWSRPARRMGQRETASKDDAKERHVEASELVEKKLNEETVARKQKAKQEKVEADKAAQEKEIEKLREVERDAPQSAPNPLVPQPEIRTSTNAFSTFSLNVSDVAFKLAAASLEHGTMPDVSTLRTEEFINAFDYRDPEAAPGAPLAFASERARYPFAQNRDVVRLSVKTAAAGRQPGKPLNVVLLLDNSGSMERADRVRILQEGLRTLSAQLQPQDKLSIVTFARTPRLWADGVAGDKAAEVTARVGEITPEGGTNLAAALDLGYATALKHYQPGSINHVVLLTDGAANLGNVDPAAMKQKVEAHRKQGIALDCFGIGWEGLNDDMLEQLSRNGDGRYGFINTPEEAATNFAAQLAGALRVAASDVKVQVEWNPKRVTSYRQVGYAKHQLTKEQFRDNTVDAAELAAAESGNALYVIEVNPRGEGDLATVRVRFKVPGTSDYREHEWTVPFTRTAAPLENSSSSLRLAASAAAFSEMLAGSPFATEVTSDRLLGLLTGVPAIYGADARPKKLEWMIRQAKSLSGR